MKKNLTLAVLVAGLSLGLSTSNASALYVADGDFNSPLGTGSYQTVNAGSSLGAWTVGNGNSIGSGGSVDFINTYWQSPSGVGGGSVDLDGNNPGSIFQTISLVAGQSYNLTFSLSGNPDGGNPIKGVQVSVGNQTQNYSFNTATAGNTESNMKYVTETLVFKATGTGSDVLKFASLDSAGSPWGAAIGKVSVSAVPLPAGLPMFAAALLALFGIQQIRKRKSVNSVA